VTPVRSIGERSPLHPKSAGKGKETAQACEMDCSTTIVSNRTGVGFSQARQPIVRTESTHHCWSSTMRAGPERFTDVACPGVSGLGLGDFDSRPVSHHERRSTTCLATDTLSAIAPQIWLRTPTASEALHAEHEACQFPNQSRRFAYLGMAGGAQCFLAN
jgi:hypothetical protein